MKSTKARRLFKRRFGQANHFLITSLIGLHEVENNPNIKKPEEFSTSWEPHDVFRSARRSREFLLDSFLSHAVDGIDLYLTYLNKSPKPIAHKDFELIFEKANRSVYNKVLGIQEYFNADKTLTGLVLLLITWRNNLTHYFAENEILGEYEIHLKNKEEEIKSQFCGLEIQQLIPKAHSGKSLTFKEVASLINATNLYVQRIDEIVISKIDFEDFANRTLDYHHKNNSGSLLKYKNLPSEKKERFKMNVLQNTSSFEPQDFEKIKHTQ